MVAAPEGSIYRVKDPSDPSLHFRGLAPELHISEDTLQRWGAVGDTVLI